MQAEQDNAMLRSRIAKTRVTFGQLLSHLGDASAGEQFREAIATLDRQHQADAQDLHATTVLAEALLEASTFEARRQAFAEAKALAVRGLALLRAIDERRELRGYWLTLYALALVRTPITALRDAPRSLTLAQRSVAEGSAADPWALYALAKAYAANGDVAGAIREAERAVAAMPPLPPGARPTGFRREIEADLATYRLQARNGGP